MIRNHLNHEDGLYLIKGILTGLFRIAIGCVLILAWMHAHGENIPEAPSPVRMALPQAMLSGIQTKTNSYWHDKWIRTFVVADFTSRTLDAISTRQFMTASCHCFHEGGNELFGFINMKSAANSTATQFAYSWGNVAINIAESRAIWWLAERHHGKTRRMMEWVSRAPLAGDATVNLQRGFIHNELFMSQIGPSSPVISPTQPSRPPLHVSFGGAQ